jgi:AdoMet-dependent heme synthase
MQAQLAEASAIDALVALGSSSSSPILMHLLLADRCNHACEHCYQVQGLKGELTRDQVESVLREFRAGGGFVVSFSGGEATLRDDLIPLLAYAHGLGLATVLYTNGFTMTEALAGAIAACHVWRVDISLYSHHAAEHDAVTRVPGSWAKTTQGIRWLRVMGVNVTLKFTPSASSTANATELAALARELDAHLFVAELVTAGEAGRLEPTDARRAPEHAISEGFADPADADANPLDGRPCGAGDQLSIRSDGLVQPCSLLHVPMGQVGTAATNLSEIAASDVAGFFREVTWADFPGCRECDLRVHCRRCYASAVAEVGDMLAPYQGACELAVERYRQTSGNPGVITRGERDVSGVAVGPYRLDSSGDLRLTKVQHTAYDAALAARYPWLRQSREALQSSACGKAPARQERGLIQLRRAQKDPTKVAVDGDSL